MKECGGCTACCRSLKVPELNKDNNEDCKLCTKGVGCNKYSERPESCRHIQCVWMLNNTGFKDESMRPDRCGVVACFGPVIDQEQGLILFEVWEGALDEDSIQSIIRTYNRCVPVLLGPAEGKIGRTFEKITKKVA